MVDCLSATPVVYSSLETEDIEDFTDDEDDDADQEASADEGYGDIGDEVLPLSVLRDRFIRPRFEKWLTTQPTGSQDLLNQLYSLLAVLVRDFSTVSSERRFEVDFRIASIKCNYLQYSYADADISLWNAASDSTERVPNVRASLEVDGQELARSAYFASATSDAAAAKGGDHIWTNPHQLSDCFGTDTVEQLGGCKVLLQFLGVICADNEVPFYAEALPFGLTPELVAIGDAGFEDIAEIVPARVVKRAAVRTPPRQTNVSAGMSMPFVSVAEKIATESLHTRANARDAHGISNSVVIPDGGNISAPQRVSFATAAIGSTVNTATVATVPTTPPTAVVTPDVMSGARPSASPQQHVSAAYPASVPSVSLHDELPPVRADPDPSRMQIPPQGEQPTLLAPAVPTAALASNSTLPCSERVSSSPSAIGFNISRDDDAASGFMTQAASAAQPKHSSPKSPVSTKRKTSVSSNCVEMPPRCTASNTPAPNDNAVGVPPSPSSRRRPPSATNVVVADSSSSEPSVPQRAPSPRNSTLNRTATPQRAASPAPKAKSRQSSRNGKAAGVPRPSGKSQTRSQSRR